MRVRVAHASLAWQNSPEEHRHDIGKIFDRAVKRNTAWITGTEAGPGADVTAETIVRVAREHGYRPWVPEHMGNGIQQKTDAWLAVRRDLIGANWKRGFDYVIPGSQQLEDELGHDIQRWGPKGVVHCSFDSTNEVLGRVAIGSAHYLTDAHMRTSKYWDLNKDLGQAIGDWARKEGVGSGIVFYGGDHNMNDAKNHAAEGDTFFGEPMKSVWDELKVWPNTGHGTIDVIATYNKDHRVRALKANVLNDREFHLATDHFYLEATFVVDPVKR